MSGRGKAERFEDLEVWRKAHKLVLAIYKLTRSFPNEEKYGLVSQMRRAAVSIPANIAEGFKKRTLRDKSNFYNIAQGSLEELRYYLILAKDLNYLTKGLNDVEENLECVNLAEEISRMLYGLIRSIQ
jgi:four helix bundle protein